MQVDTSREDAGAAYHGGHRAVVSEVILPRHDVQGQDACSWFGDGGPRDPRRRSQMPNSAMTQLSHFTPCRAINLSSVLQH